MDTPEFIISAVTKLMRLADDPRTNENEAAAAAVKAAEMLEKYNLDMAIFHPEEQEDIVLKSIEQKLSNGLPNRNLIKWKQEFAIGLGRFFSCEVLVGGKTTIYIGFKRDVEIASYIYETITRKIDQLATAKTKEYSAQFENVKTLRGNVARNVWRRSWAEGAAQGVLKTLRDKDEERKAKYDRQSSALILQRYEQAREWSKQRFPNAYRERRLRKHDKYDYNNLNYGAWSEGYAEGKKIEVDLALSRGDKRGELHD